MPRNRLTRRREHEKDKSSGDDRKSLRGSGHTPERSSILSIRVEVCTVPASCGTLLTLSTASRRRRADTCNRPLCLLCDRPFTGHANRHGDSHNVSVKAGMRFCVCVNLRSIRNLSSHLFPFTNGRFSAFPCLPELPFPHNRTIDTSLTYRNQKRLSSPHTRTGSGACFYSLLAHPSCSFASGPPTECRHCLRGTGTVSFLVRPFLQSVGGSIRKRDRTQPASGPSIQSAREPISTPSNEYLHTSFAQFEPAPPSPSSSGQRTFRRGCSQPHSWASSSPNT